MFIHADAENEALQLTWNSARGKAEGMFILEI